MIKEPHELVILTPPAGDATLDTSLVDDEVARLLAESATVDSAAKDGETLQIHVPIAGRQVSLDVPPWAIQGLVIDRYCAAGWPAVNELGAAVIRASAGSTRRGALFVRELVNGSTLLEQLVSEAIIRITADAVRIATKRITDLKTHLDVQAARYGLALAETKAPEGAGGRPGTDNAAPDNENPEVEARGDAVEARALAAVVRRMIAARRLIVAERRDQSGGGLEAAGGAGGSDSFTKRDIDPVSDEPIAAAQRAFVELCGEVTMAPRGHTIAPAVFALLRRGNVLVDEDVTDRAIWSKAFVYLRDARASLGRALPAQFPFHNLRERLDMSIAAVATERPSDAIDRPELRAAMWASERLRGYAYEPLDDEAILVDLQKELAAKLVSASDDSLEAVFRYRVIAELITARDMRDEIIAMKATERAPLAAVDRGAGIFGLLGLVFPPANLPAIGLGLYAAAGHALAAIHEIDPENRAIDAQVIGALLAADSERYAHLVASRPSVSKIIWQMLGAVATFQVVGKVSRTWAVGLQVYFDLVAVEPRVQTWITGQMVE